ncbi:carboxypeptidase-like regulatory domain-containing protein [Flavobacterium aquatile]|uniref:TonB-dependent receptor n=1 Tax=Flavobacterium aquatile LMG 4008 = ATCC 11947 TaxID=1453498 RepID=A0A095U434_9FLAO|nr:carboxypeptidase-like regulatory domain-containing protein [Flavobacterium aquatile]KGD69408.1 TonB-dependent receptor [Flavobacterium aquatile LMG 4008 = ATCC 11947]OXA66138.1 TonB-dependent receptor [Flavobacterium aquatile] [Flavobacterium aquatile LMG 4008 = ATCC 11947]GEC77624.1 TonB-dependent receptor [Flavobacterium aquatile]
MKKILLFALLFTYTISLSQTIRFEGSVLESGKTPLEMANVMAVNQATKAVDAYGITNDKGKFVLNLNKNATYNVKISYLGMQNKEITITTQSENITQNITLEPGGIELEGVEIVREMPVSIKGDTIVYNADSFKTGTERKLEDILKKLPGVEVNADGEVEVEGKKVTKLMVEGKDFFDGDTKLGVKNIPADAIDKVQVLRNYNENSILKGVENNQDNIAMNIKLKSGKKNFWFGDMTAGIGVGHDEERYLINPKLFYYNPKYSINIITNFNNIGELPLTIQDYFKFTGGFRNMMGKGGSSFNVSSNDLGISLLRNNRAKEIETNFGATNFSYNVTKTWSLSGFGIISSSITDLETKSQTNIFVPNSSEVATTENREEVAHQKSSLGLFKLSSSYKPSARFQFDYDVLGKISKQDENNNLLRESIVSGTSDTENIFTSKKQDPTSLNQNLSAYYTQSDKNIFAFEMQHLYQDEDPFYNANLETQPFNLLGYTSGENRNDINQSRFVKTNKIDAKLDYYYMVTPKSNINVTLGNTYSHQTFDSSIYQVLDDGSVNDLDNPTNTNDVTYNFNDAFLGLHYKILSGKFTFTPGVSFHSYDMTNTQLGSKFNMNFFRILPDFLAIYQIKKSETLTYNFGLTNNFTDINRLAEGFVLNGYNSLSRGSRTLENSTVQSHSLTFRKFNMFNFENINANINYTKSVDAVKTQSVFDGVNQSSSPFNSDFADESISGFASYGRSFLKNYKASFNTRLNWSKFNNIQNTILVTNESFTQVHSLSLSTNYKNLPNLEVGYSLTINDYAGSKFYTDRPSARLDYYFLKSFSFVSEYEFYHYYNADKTVENEYDFLSASLIYQKKDSKWEYKVAATNLLNTTSLNDDSFSQFSTRTSQYTVQPRYIILSLKYNL